MYKPRVNAIYGLLVIKMHHCRLIVSCKNVPLWHGIVIVGKVVCVGAEGV